MFLSKVTFLLVSSMLPNFVLLASLRFNWSENSEVFLKPREGSSLPEIVKKVKNESTGFAMMSFELVWFGDGARNESGKVAG